MSSGRLRLSVRISPGSSTAGVSPAGDGSFRVRLRSRPVENRANNELIALLADEFGVPRSCVRIISGGHGRAKVVEITDPSATPPWLEHTPR